MGKGHIQFLKNNKNITSALRKCSISQRIEEMGIKTT